MNPGHTSTQHFELPTRQLCDAISKVIISVNCNEAIAKNILLWVKHSEPKVLAI